jgi:hypothetical protein
MMTFLRKLGVKDVISSAPPPAAAEHRRAA